VGLGLGRGGLRRLFPLGLFSFLELEFVLPLFGQRGLLCSENPGLFHFLRVFKQEIFDFELSLAYDDRFDALDGYGGFGFLKRDGVWFVGLGITDIADVLVRQQEEDTVVEEYSSLVLLLQQAEQVSVLAHDYLQYFVFSLLHNKFY